MSIDAAIPIAEVEQALGVNATYFVLLRSEMYNHFQQLPAPHWSALRPSVTTSACILMLRRTAMTFARSMRRQPGM